MTPRPDESGVVLLNVLLIVAVASAVVVVMTAAQDVGVQRALRLREAAQAGAIARAGELSAVVALRRDKAAAPQSDHLREAWAGVGQVETAIQGGRFSLAISDAQARFNVNNLAGGGLAARDTLAKLLAAAGAPAEIVDRIAAYIEATGPVGDMASLGRLGIDPAVLARIEATVTALPTPTAVNVNTAGEELMAVMLASLLERRVVGGKPGVFVIARRRGAATLGEAPPP